MKKQKQKFRIIYLKKKEKITVDRFECYNRSQAYKYLLKYIENHKDNRTYYYTTAGGYIHVDKDGNRIETDTLFDQFHKSKLEDIKLNEYHKGYNKAKKETTKDLKKDITHYIKTGHNIYEWYNLYNHILEDLTYNLPILIKKHVGYPIINKDDNEKQGDITWTNMLKELLLDVKLYNFYADYGIMDFNTKEDKEFYEKYKHTIPILKGTYDDLDYKKISKLCKYHWNKIWNFMKKYGQTLWD